MAWASPRISSRFPMAPISPGIKRSPSCIFEQNEEVPGIGRGGDEIEMFVEAPRLLIFCMYSQGAYPRDLSRPQCALHRIL